MKKEVLAGLAIVSATAMTTYLEGAYANDSRAEASRNIKVDVATLPDHLPTAVAKNIGSVAASEFQYDLTTPTTVNSNQPEAIGTEFASAVRIAPNTYLSAGHYLYSPNDTQKLQLSDPCRTIEIYGPSVGSPNKEKKNSKTVMVPGTAMAVDKFTGSYIKGDMSTTPDVSILQAIDIRHTLPKEPSARLSNGSVRIGEDVYFVNFQPTASELHRNPDELAEEQFNTEYGLDSSSNNITTPAIYGGVVFGKQSNGDPEVVGNLKSYDKQGDKESISGASGGAVFNSKGQLIGITVESSEEPLPLRDLDEVFQVDLAGLPKDAMPQPIIVQPVNQRLIRRLKGALKMINACRLYK